MMAVFHKSDIMLPYVKILIKTFNENTTSIKTKIRKHCLIRNNDLLPYFHVIL